MKANFNIYHFFAGTFVPFWLLSRQVISAGAKLTYAMLAQQANSRGVTQLHFQAQATALGEDEGLLARHLTELEEVGLIQVSRGNVHQEDIRSPDDRSTESHTLPLSPGELSWLAVQQVFQLQHSSHLVNPLPDFGFRDLAHL